MIFTEICHNYIIITGCDKNDTHYKRKGKFVSKNISHNINKNKNQSMRKRGGIKQPGGSSCNQRR